MMDIRKIKMPTAEDDARIQKGIALDPDARELTDEDFARMQPASKTHPELIKQFRNKDKPSTRRQTVPEEPEFTAIAHKSKDKHEEFKAIRRVHEMGVGSLSPDRFEELVGCLKLLSEARGIPWEIN